MQTFADISHTRGEPFLCYDADGTRHDGQIILACQELLLTSVSPKGLSMREPSGFQLSGSAPTMYERYIVSTLTAALAKDLVTLAALQPGEHILDVACGTGTVTRQAAQAVGPTGEVIGLDVNADMLQVARTLAPPEHATLFYREGSAMALPFPEATFHVVLCQHGLEFFPDRGHSLQEMRRVLIPEGRLGVRVWRALEHQAFHTAVFASLDRHLWGGQDVPSRTGFVQPFSLGDAAHLQAFVRDAGFRDIEVSVSTMPIRLGANTTDLLGYLSALPVGSAIATMEETAREAMLHEAMTALQPFVEAEAFRIPAASHVVLARR
jgi:ubiquinone/menaquinone biosynthesis C-methylase UbiE